MQVIDSMELSGLTRYFLIQISSQAEFELLLESTAESLP
jgi:hypothetical protein